MTDKQDFDESLLTAYIDDELDASERARVEAELKSSPSLQRTLQELQSVRGMLSSYFANAADPVATSACRGPWSTNELANRSDSLDGDRDDSSVANVQEFDARLPEPNLSPQGTRSFPWAIVVGLAASTIAISLMTFPLWNQPDRLSLSKNDKIRSIAPETSDDTKPDQLSRSMQTRPLHPLPGSESADSQLGAPNSIVMADPSVKAESAAPKSTASPEDVSLSIRTEDSSQPPASPLTELNRDVETSPPNGNDHYYRGMVTEKFFSFFAQVQSELKSENKLGRKPGDGQTDRWYDLANPKEVSRYSSGSAIDDRQSLPTIRGQEMRSLNRAIAEQSSEAVEPTSVWLFSPEARVFTYYRDGTLGGQAESDKVDDFKKESEDRLTMDLTWRFRGAEVARANGNAAPPDPHTLDSKNASEFTEAAGTLGDVVAEKPVDESKRAEAPTLAAADASAGLGESDNRMWIGMPQQQAEQPADAASIEFRFRLSDLDLALTSLEELGLSLAAPESQALLDGQSRTVSVELGFDRSEIALGEEKISESTSREQGLSLNRGLEETEKVSVPAAIDPQSTRDADAKSDAIDSDLPATELGLKQQSDIPMGLSGRQKQNGRENKGREKSSRVARWDEWRTHLDNLHKSNETGVSPEESQWIRLRIVMPNPVIANPAPNPANDSNK